MKIVGLHFMLEYGHYVQAFVHDDEARQCVHEFASGGFKVRDKLTVGDQDFRPVPNTKGEWAIRIDRIVAVVVVELDQQQGPPPLVKQQQQPRQQSAAAPWAVPKSSG